MPLVRPNRAFVPSAVLLPALPPSGGWLTPKAFGVGASAKQQSASGMKRRPRRKGDRLIKFGTGRVAVLSGVGRFIGSFFLLPVVNRGTIRPGQDGGASGSRAPRARFRFYFGRDDSANIPAICQDQITRHAKQH